MSAALALTAQDWGAGSPLLILHGVFGSSRNWSGIAQRLADLRRVSALDARNHGASPWADTMSYVEMSDDVLAFCQGRELGAVDLVGHSMGGKTAMLFALRHAERVQRLVVVDVAPVVYRPVLATYAHAMRVADLNGVTRRADVDRQLAPAVADAAERAFLLQNLVLDGGTAHWRLNLPVIERAMPELSGFPKLPDMPHYAGPTLFIAGERSGYVRPEHRPAIMRFFPKAHVLRIREAGHWLHAERPDAFIATLRPFLGA